MKLPNPFRRALPPPASWPSGLREGLWERYGAAHRIEPRPGVVRADAAWRVSFRKCELLVKRAGVFESAFYVTDAPVLRAAGVPVPSLEAAWTEERGDEFDGWLVLEYVPRPLPRPRWLADPAVLEALRRLHAFALPLEQRPRFEPRWPEEWNEVLPDARETLARLRREALPLLEPHAWISGDPNPTNWGLRASGDVVLFDWERFGRGHPALDLAITVPGLGTVSDFAAVAQVYERAGGARVAPREIAVAKAWSVVEFLATAPPHPSAPLRESIPAWLQALAAG